MKTTVNVSAKNIQKT